MGLYRRPVMKKREKKKPNNFNGLNNGKLSQVWQLTNKLLILFIS